MSDRLTMSIPVNKKVCGYEIRKMPIGAYLLAMRKLKGLPDEFLEICFPGMSLQEVIEQATNFNEEMLKAAVYNFFVAAPDYGLEVLSDLTGIDKDKLINDENIGLDGLLDIITVFVEVNGLGKFISGVKALLKKANINVPGMIPHTGFKE